LVVWAADTDRLVTALARGDGEAQGDNCAVVREGLKILRAPVGSRAYVDEALKGIIA
jgi:hypothetical protein